MIGKPRQALSETRQATPLGGGPVGEPTAATPERGLRDLLVWAAVAGLCAAWLVLAFANGHAAYWYNPDEAIYWSLAATGSLGEMMRAIHQQAHPPGFFLLTRFALEIHDGITWLRLPSLLAGASLPALIFLLGRRLGGVAVGLVAALVAAGSTALIEQALLVRPYLLQVALLSVAALALLRSRDSGRPGALVLYGLAMGAALFLVYSSVLVLAGFGVVILIGWLRGAIGPRAMRSLVVVHAPLALLVLGLALLSLGPGLVRSTLEKGEPPPWMINQYADGVLPVLGNAAKAAGAVWGYVAPPGLAVLLVLAGLVLAWWHGRRELPLLVLVCAVLACTLALAKLYPLGGTRHSLYLFPWLAVALAWPMAAALSAPGWPRRGVGLVLLAVLVLVQAGSLRGLHVALERRGTRERVVLRSAADAVRAQLEALADERALCITDPRTFWLLEPLLGLRGRELATLETAAGALQHARWRALDIVLSPDGRGRLLTGRHQGRGRGAHLETILHRLALHPASATRLQAGPVCVIQGGWGPTFERTVDARTPDGATVWSGLAGGRGLHVARLDVAGYRAWLGTGP
jgi:hypothetical protein